MKKNIINLILLLFFIILVFISTLFLKNIQLKNFDKIISEVETLEKEKIKYKISYLNKYKISIIPENLFTKNMRTIGEKYHGQYGLQELLILNLDIDVCKEKTISFLIKYKTSGPDNSLNFSKILKINTTNSKNYIFFPVYHTIKMNNDKIFYKGIFYSLDMDLESYKCLKNIVKLKDVTNLSFPSFAFYSNNNHININSINKINYGNTYFDVSEINNLNIKKNFLINQKPIKFLTHAKRSNDCERNSCSYPNECYIDSMALLASKESEKICRVNNDFYEIGNLKLEKNDIIIIFGEIFNGKFKINIISEKDLYDGELINSNNKFKFFYKVPRDDIYNIIFSYENNLYNYTENNILIDKIVIANNK